MTLQAFADESYDERSPWYVVAGYVGGTRHWSLFKRRWMLVKQRERILDIGFHANRCKGGYGEYAEVGEERRERIQKGLLAAIHESKLRGFVVALHRANWKETFKPAFHAALLPDVRKHNKEYLMAAYPFVHMVSRRLMKRVDYTFHRRPKGATAGWEEWYESLRPGALGPYIGAFAFKSNEQAPPLDAADFLAYFAYLHLLGERTWQWDALEQYAAIEFFGLDRQDWENGVAQLKDETSE